RAKLSRSVTLGLAVARGRSPVVALVRVPVVAGLALPVLLTVVPALVLIGLLPGLLPLAGVDVDRQRGTVDRGTASRDRDGVARRPLLRRLQRQGAQVRPRRRRH